MRAEPAGLLTVLMVAGCASALYLTETVPRPQEDVVACLEAELETLGYDVERSFRDRNSLDARKQTSGFGLAAINEGRTFDIITVAVGEGGGGSRIRLSAETKYFGESMYGRDEKRVESSGQVSQDAGHVLGLCSGRVAPEHQYAIWQWSDRGVQKYLTAADGTEVLFPHRPLQHAAAGSWLAFPYTHADSAYLVLLNRETGSSKVVHSVGPGFHYTFDWSSSPDRLAVGYFNQKEDGRRFIPDDGGIFIADTLGTVRDLGCTVAREVRGWVGSDRLAVSDGNNIYVVGPADCRTLATIPTQQANRPHRFGFQFSPDGKYVAFRQGGALFLASWDGSGTTVVADANYEPTNVAWSPDGSILVFQIASQEFSDRHHIAVRPVLSGDARVIVGQDPQRGLADDRNPVFLPDRNAIVFDRVWMEGHPAGTFREKVFLDLSAGQRSAPRVLYQQRQPWGESVFEHWIGPTWGWADEALIAVASAAQPGSPQNAVQKVTILDLTGKVLYRSRSARPMAVVVSVKELR